MMDMIISKGLDVWIVLEVVGLSLPFMFAVTVPMSVLVAMVVSFGRLSGDNEIISFKSSGVSLYRLMISPTIFSFIVFVGMIYFNNQILPNTNHRLKNLLMDINQKSPMLDIKEGIFTKFESDYEILVRKKDEKKPIAYGVIIYEPNQNGPPTTIVAEKAEMNYLDNGQRLKIVLYDGEVHEIDNNDPKGYKRIVFKEHIINIKSNASLRRTSRTQRGDREMSAQDMLMLIYGWNQEIAGQKEDISLEVENRFRYLLNLEEKTVIEEDTTEAILLPYPLLEINYNALGLNPSSQQSKINMERIRRQRYSESFSNDSQFSSRLNTHIDEIKRLEKEIAKYMVEVHKKYSMPFACFVFVLLGIPLGIMSRGGGIGIGIGISMGFFVVYWIFIMTGEKLADRLILTPFMSMWLANGILGPLGLYLSIRSVRETSMIDWDNLRNRINPFKRITREPVEKTLILATEDEIQSLEEQKAKNLENENSSN